MRSSRLLMLSVVALALAAPGPVRAHCDTLDGPVVADARAAIEARRLEAVLKWVREADEAEVRAAFERALRVRGLGPEARELADRHFFETLVRVHRAGEGAPYAGLKPAGSVEPPVAAADRALESGSVDALVEAVTAQVARDLRERFERARAARAAKDESVEKGRAYVARYVAYVHYVEAIHGAGHAAEAH